MQQKDDSNPRGNNVVYKMLPLGLRYPVILLVTFHEIEQQIEWRRPDLILRKMQLGDAVIKEPGKQLFNVFIR